MKGDFLLAMVLRPLSPLFFLMLACVSASSSREALLHLQKAALLVPVTRLLLKINFPKTNNNRAESAVCRMHLSTFLHGPRDKYTLSATPPENITAAAAFPLSQKRDRRRVNCFTSIRLIFSSANQRESIITLKLHAVPANLYFYCPEKRKANAVH